MTAQSFEYAADFGRSERSAQAIENDIGRSGEDDSGRRQLLLLAQRQQRLPVVFDVHAAGAGRRMLDTQFCQCGLDSFVADPLFLTSAKHEVAQRSRLQIGSLRQEEQFVEWRSDDDA